VILGELGATYMKVESYDLLETEPASDELPLDEAGHNETWNDVLRLQQEGIEPAIFRTISARVLMIHGDIDPHPGALTHELLRQFIPGLEYIQLDRCGHEPWRERPFRRGGSGMDGSKVGRSPRKARRASQHRSKAGSAFLCFPPWFRQRFNGTVRLSHINVSMPKGGEDMARAFYGRLLGLREIPKPEPLRVRGGVWLNADGLDVHVSVEEQRGSANAQRHFGLECSDVDRLRASLMAAGVETDDGRPAPWKRFFVRDPFDNRIEIHEAGALRA